jgi:trans-aconitate 2-methyltransferase
MAKWDPATYLQFADERARPFFELVGRIGAESPASVVDLGCGPGQLTAALADRWPAASVVGLDSSADMIAAAAAHSSDRVRFELADLREWTPADRVDVIVSNATLQWVPDHRSVIASLVAALRDGGWLAFQVPGNFDEPSHALLRELAADARFATELLDLAFPSSHEPATYLGDLLALGCAADVWETTYLHVLDGPDAVFRWISGTGARPVLQALPDRLREQFVAEYKARLRDAYPGTSSGTVLPFRRIFCVARRPATRRSG